MQPTKEWPHRYTKELMDEAKAAFEKYAKRDLGYDEVEESISNLVNFYLALLEAHKESQGQKALLRPDSDGRGTSPK